MSQNALLTEIASRVENTPQESNDEKRPFLMCRNVVNGRFHTLTKYGESKIIAPR